MRRIAVLALAIITLNGLNFTQTHKFPIKRTKLDPVFAHKGIPLLEGNVIYQKSPPAVFSSSAANLPDDLSNVEYAAIPFLPTIEILGLRGTDGGGELIYVFDSNTDKDLSNEKRLGFHLESDKRTARVPISYQVEQNGKFITKATELTLHERTQGKLEYHFNELWETELSVGDETLVAALQRWPILFIDVNFSGIYDKLFFTEREVLALSGSFFHVNIDFAAEEIHLEKADRTPVDKGFAAPEFEVDVWQSEKSFNLSEHKGAIVVLTFWSPLCPGSKAEAPHYSRLAGKYNSDPSIVFLAVANDEAALEEYMKNESHNCKHCVSPELWDLYGVSAPFVTFLIDSNGVITERYFQFSSRLEDKILSLLQNPPRL